MTIVDDPHSLGFSVGLLGLPRKPSMDKSLQLWLHMPRYRALAVQQWVQGYDEGASERELTSEGPVGPLEAHEREYAERKLESDQEAWERYQADLDALAFVYPADDYDWYDEDYDMEYGGFK